MIENWNHGRGVGRFFPLFSSKRGISSSIGMVIRTGGNKREQRDGWMIDKMFVIESFTEPDVTF